MEKNLPYLMSLQVKALEEMLENMQEEQNAIINSNNQKMRKVLARRRIILAAIQYWGYRVCNQIERETYPDEISLLNGQILCLTDEIDRRNKRNKLLLILK